MNKQYPWVQENRERARMNREAPVMGSSVHAGYNREMRYTGNGATNEVAEYAPGGQAIHKGEMVFGGPGNGQVVMNANESRELMSNPVIGGRMSSPSGYQTGGVINDEPKTAETATPATPVTAQKTTPSTGEAMRSKGISGIKNIMDTGSVAGRVAGQKQISDLKSTQDVERQVLKQEAAQREMGDSQASGMLARKTASDAGALSNLESNVAIEGMQAKERAAGTLASEGMSERRFEEGVRQFEVGSEQWNRGFEEDRRRFEVGSEQWNRSFTEQRRQFDVGSEQWNKSFEEQRRQFNVGSEQWNRSFDEQRRQFDVGSEQWNKSFAEQVREYDQNFNEQVRQFEIGSAQWEKAFEDNRKYKWETFEEQKRQFEVGSAQWEKARQDQLSQWSESFNEQRRQFDVGSAQWEKSFNEERRQYDNEDRRWWTSYDEQRRQFDVGTTQWDRSFNEQTRQFDVGTTQWQEVQDLRVKDFQRGLDMDKHTIDVWKDNISYRDKAYLDTRKDIDLNNEMQRDAHEKNMQLIDHQIDATANDDKSKNYWDGSKRMYNYASTHLNGYNEDTGEFTPDAEAEMFEWFKAKYPGAESYSSLEGLKNSGYKKGYEDFKAWAETEWKAATDNRLTNPYDKMLYDVRSSNELDDDAKKVIEDVLGSPEALASISGVTYNPETGQVQFTTNDPDLQPKNTLMPTQTVSYSTKGDPTFSLSAPGSYSLSEGNPFSTESSDELKKASPKTIGDFQTKFNSGDININTLKGAYDNMGKDINSITKVMRNSGNPNSPNNKLYKQLVTDSETMKSLSVNDTNNEIKNIPSVGSIVNVEGRLMMVTDKGTKGKSWFDGIRKYDYFDIVDLSTGEEKRWGGKKNSDYVGGGGSNLKTWALNLDGR